MSKHQLFYLIIAFFFLIRLIFQIRTIIKNKEYKNVVKEYEKEKKERNNIYK